MPFDDLSPLVVSTNTFGLSVSPRPPPEPDLWHQKQRSLSVFGKMQWCSVVSTKTWLLQALLLTDCCFSIPETMSSPYHPKGKPVPSTGFNSGTTSIDLNGKPQTSHQSHVSQADSKATVDQEVDNLDSEAGDFVA